MKANNLRIGNYYQENGTTYTTEYYDIANLVRCELNNVVSDMQPIPLTEEWLVKLGFTNNDGDFEIEFGRQAFTISLAQDTDWVLLFREDVGLNFNALMFLDHVHQLQNLIFALTGEELTIKS